MSNQKTKTFRVTIECEMELPIGKKITDDVFAEDSDFAQVCEEIVNDCLKYNADDIHLRSIQETKEG